MHGNEGAKHGSMGVWTPPECMYGQLLNTRGNVKIVHEDFDSAFWLTFLEFLEGKQDFLANNHSDFILSGI